MLRILLSFFTLTILLTSSAIAQNITGDWYGKIDAPGNPIRINFHVTEDNGTYKTTMDSPDQNAFGIPTDTTSFENNELIVKVSAANVEYKGTLKDDVVTGTFSQNNYPIALNLSRTEVKKEELVVPMRPQDPKEPYNYISEDVTFTNAKAESIKLAGTLTLPKGVKNPPVAILITGSGAQDRNSEIKAVNHRPFLVLSDYLTNNGIAVLRYDDRGVAESEGTQQGATSADFATDVEAAVGYLKTRTDIDTNKIGLIGHSEGGFIAPMVASKDKSIAFIVLLAGTGVDGSTISQGQTRLILEQAGLSETYVNLHDKLTIDLHKIIKENYFENLIKAKLIAHLENYRQDNDNELSRSLTDEAILQYDQLGSNWEAYFIRTNPDDFLSQVSCPVLALNGSKDIQILPKLNLDGIKKSLEKANNKDVTIKELEGLNHLFQKAETGSLQEYGQIDETINPVALELISNWILERFK